MQDLLTKYFGKGLSEAERHRMFSMLVSDGDFREAFLDTVRLKALSGWIPQDEDIYRAVSKLYDFKKRQEPKAKAKVFPQKQILGYAAVVCMAVLSTWLVMKFMQRNVGEESYVSETSVYEEFVAPVGQRAQVRLADGTVVWLNANSTLRYPEKFDRKERRVELDGEAYFEVAENEKHPFVVVTDKLHIQVKGTKFDVFAYKDREDFSASLIDGEIELFDKTSKGVPVTLKPKERIDFVAGRYVKSRYENEDFLLWKTGVYAFDDKPFAAIVKKLELYYDVSIEVKNKRLNAYKFSGKFRQRDGIESLLKTLQKVHPFTYVKDDERNRITIK